MDRNNVGEESPVRHVSMLTSSNCCLRPRMRSDGGMQMWVGGFPSSSWVQFIQEAGTTPPGAARAQPVVSVTPVP